MFLTNLFLILSGSILILLIKICKQQNIWKRKNVPHKKPTFILGNCKEAAFYKKHIWDVVDDVYNFFKNERYFGFYQFTTPILVLKEPNLIKEITVKEFDHFSNHAEFITEGVDKCWDKNLLAMKSPQWKHMRSTLGPAFTSSKLKFMFQFFLHCAEDFCNHFLQMNEDVIDVKLKNIFSRFANDVIATTAFGLECNSLKNPSNLFYSLGQKATRFLRRGTSLMYIHRLSSILPKLLKLKIIEDDVYAFFSRVINESLRMRRQNGMFRKDMLQLLLEAQRGTLNDNDNGNEQKITNSSFTKSDKELLIEDEDIISQAMIFLMAGTDTTSTAMSLTGYELMLNPNIQNRLRDEIDDAYENSNRKVTYETIINMKYLDMVISEALRKWPPAPVFDRKCTKTYTIPAVRPHEKPLVIEKGSVIWLPAYSLHRDPEFYPNPDIFDPERFSEKNKQNINPFTYIPFGTGPRGCIGSRFAILEIKVLLFYILRHFEIIPTKQNIGPLEMKKGDFSFAAVNDFEMAFKKRLLS